MVEQHPKLLSVLRRKQVQARTGLSRSTIYQRVAEGSFPKPISLGARAIGWLESEIHTWLSSKIKESRSSSAKSNVLGEK